MRPLPLPLPLVVIVPVSVPVGGGGWSVTSRENFLGLPRIWFAILPAFSSRRASKFFAPRDGSTSGPKGAARKTCLLGGGKEQEEYCARFWEGRGNFLDLSPTTHHHRLVLRTRGTGTETGTITTRGRGRGRGRTGRLNCMGSPAPQTSGSFLPSRFPSRSSSRCAVLVSQHSRDACCNTRMQTL